MHRSGLTLVETLAAVAILVALAVAAVPSWQALVRAQGNATVEDEALEALLVLDADGINKVLDQGGQGITLAGREDLRLVVEELDADLAPPPPAEAVLEHLAPQTFLVVPTPRRYVRLAIVTDDGGSPLASLVRLRIDHPRTPPEATP